MMKLISVMILVAKVPHEARHKISRKNHQQYNACTSLMFCGSATGQLLPVYVVYKALLVKICHPIFLQKFCGCVAGITSNSFACQLIQLTKTQSLDVAIFMPLKIKWHKILNSWKSSHPKENTVPKSVFPKLLK